MRAEIPMNLDRNDDTATGDDASSSHGEPSAVLSVHGLRKKYGSFEALKGVDFEVTSGSVFGLLGPNGAGKTTAIKIVMGLLRPDEGSVSIGGIDAVEKRVEAKKLVGYLPDEPVFFDYLRGREIVEFSGRMFGLSKTEIAERALELAERLEMEDVLSDFAENYSRGMRKKLGLICAMLHRPQLLILDEPTNGLDPHSTLELHQIMREHADSGCAVFFSTHLLDQAERVCDQMAILSNGSVVSHGGLDDLKAKLAESGGLEALFFEVTGRSVSGESKLTAEEQNEEAQS